VQTWLLADLAEAISHRPSQLLRLPEAGVGDADCLDFDFAVRALKRWADRRSDETIRVRDHDPEPPPGVRMKTVPKYPTLLAVLGMDDETAPESETASRDVDDLLAAMLVNPTEWEGFSGA
jgi:hypothetical protein